VGRDSKGRLFINANAVFWIFRIGAPWRDLPPDHRDWKNTHRRFCRWKDKGIWKNTHRRFCRWKDKGIWISILSELTFKEIGSV